MSFDKFRLLMPVDPEEMHHFHIVDPTADAARDDLLHDRSLPRTDRDYLGSRRTVHAEAIHPITSFAVAIALGDTLPETLPPPGHEV